MTFISGFQNRRNFFRADLVKDTSKELSYAEQMHKKGEASNDDKK